tara:strand:+ start:3828 stop:3944 length:117 start_codon:yes stop_codon:yes gene_type:complete
MACIELKRMNFLKKYFAFGRLFGYICAPRQTAMTVETR